MLYVGLVLQTVWVLVLIEEVRVSEWELESERTCDEKKDLQLG